MHAVKAKEHEPRLTKKEALEMKKANGKFLAKICLLSDCREITGKEENEMLKKYHETKLKYEAILSSHNQ